MWYRTISAELLYSDMTSYMCLKYLMLVLLEHFKILCKSTFPNALKSTKDMSEVYMC